MQFAGIDNAFGTDTFTPPASPARYYKSLRIETPKVKLPRAPKPPSHYLKNFLLTYNG